MATDADIELDYGDIFLVDTFLRINIKVYTVKPRLGPGVHEQDKHLPVRGRPGPNRLL